MQGEGEKNGNRFSSLVHFSKDEGTWKGHDFSSSVDGF